MTTLGAGRVAAACALAALGVAARATSADRIPITTLTEHLGSEIGPLRALLGPLSEQIERLDEQVGELAVKDERVRRLLTMPQIGPVTAVSFVATLDEVGRFQGAHQVEAYLGLSPREWSSSEVQRRGRITKAGSSRMRWLLVEAAWRVATHKKRAETLALREWVDRIARRTTRPGWEARKRRAPRWQPERMREKLFLLHGV